MIDNTVPTATDIQAVNGTGTAKTIDAGDVVTFSYSEAMAPASILTGWTGTATTVTVRVNNVGSARHAGGLQLGEHDAAEPGQRRAQGEPHDDRRRVHGDDDHERQQRR